MAVDSGANVVQSSTARMLGNGHVPMPLYREASALYLTEKRVIDLVGAVILLAILLPLFAIAALAVFLDSGWPVFYRGERVGQAGKTFKVLKFRSMRADADAGVHATFVRQLLEGDPGHEGAVYKVFADPRVTRVGSLLRKTSVDELPQLWNVITGEMSLVGPRPDVSYCVEKYEPWMYRRLVARPGMTGLWQVSGRSRLSLREMLRLDVEYVDHRSLWLDVRILLMTMPAVIATSDSA